MKRVILRNSFHNTQTMVYAPEIYDNTLDVYDWLWKEGEEEHRKRGSYSKNRKRFLEARRRLCGIEGCQCNLVDDEEC